MKKHFTVAFEEIICVENLINAWEEFIVGKRNKKDVQLFAFQLMDNILQLHYELREKIYRHGVYKSFHIFDPKPRNIHKATVRDRLVHHAVYRQLYPLYDKVFISDSYSCRQGKGTHKALRRFTQYARSLSQNNTKTCWILKCDIKKFFDSIDHAILMSILNQRISDKNIIRLISEIVGSFYKKQIGIGLPLGNVTSQLLVNVYMNEFDQFVKHRLKLKHYMRYADDFVIFSRARKYLRDIAFPISVFLKTRLQLALHPDKVFIKTLASGVDFLGWVHFPDHHVLRTTTKRRMFRKLGLQPKEASLASYTGLLKHGNAHKLKSEVLKLFQKP